MVLGSSPVAVTSPSDLSRHFHSGEHTGVLENVKIILIDKTDGQNPKKRKDTGREPLRHAS